MVEARAPSDTKVLVTGATGFVGKHVCPVLEREGYQVIGASRDPQSARAHYPGREFRQLDLRDAGSVRAALEGCHAAVYLVHSMATGSNYEKEERKSATTFREAAAAAGLERIVYLGGMPPNGKPSKHLRSRMATGEVLRGGKVPTIELQATMVIGSGSESFRMVRDLSARLPVMLLPSWSKSLTEPIAIDDVTFAIAAALTRVPAQSAEYPLPGPEIVSAREILARTAKLLGRSPRLYYLPLISPKLSSYWIRLVTRGDHHVTDELVQGLRTDILAPDLGFWKHCPEHQRIGFDDAVRSALNGEEESLSVGALLVERAIERISPEQPGGQPGTQTP
ncbi:MAG: NAD-dependent epimerase/dehydratase [Myxococcaceae bacterium]|nr:NAD-dependent epimerase/dehydratase [Myxococcaceae bacterium]